MKIIITNQNRTVNFYSMETMASTSSEQNYIHDISVSKNVKLLKQVKVSVKFCCLKNNICFFWSG